MNILKELQNQKIIENANILKLKDNDFIIFKIKEGTSMQDIDYFRQGIYEFLDSLNLDPSSNITLAFTDCIEDIKVIRKE